MKTQRKFSKVWACIVFIFYSCNGFFGVYLSFFFHYSKIKAFKFFISRLTAEVRVLVFPIRARSVAIARQLPLYTTSSEDVYTGTSLYNYSLNNLNDKELF